jgi:hypothetical protein
MCIYIYIFQTLLIFSKSALRKVHSEIEKELHRHSMKQTNHNKKNDEKYPTTSSDKIAAGEYSK